jgi:hypothetical protein
MTAVADAEDATALSGARRGTVADPTMRARAYRFRWVLASFAVLLAATVGLAYYGSTAHGGTLDPRSYDPSGSHALSVLLKTRGVSTTTVTDVGPAIGAAAAGGTLVVVRPDFLSDAQLRRLGSTPSDLVIVGADNDEVNALGPAVAGAGIAAFKLGYTDIREPSCGLAAATTAGDAAMGGIDYQADPSTVRCYPNGSGPPGFGLVSFRAGHHQVTLLGNPAALENSSLGDDGNAALAVGLLDAHSQLVWLVPPAVSPAVRGGQEDITDLLPSRLKLALVQLVLAIIVVALWRGRRFGRLVREELPVVVRQAEVVVGRARLYQRSRSLDSAGGALRTGLRDRLSRRLGFGPNPDPTTLIDAISARTHRPADDIGQLLYGATPVDDHALVALAQALSVLEQEVART